MKNFASIILYIVTLTACGYTPDVEIVRGNANDIDPPDESFIDNSTTKCVVSSSSEARTAEYKKSTGLDAICASYAYDKGYTGKGQTVSVLDTPFFIGHKEFIDDNDGSAFTAGYDGSSGGNNISCSTICNDNATYHGTHVAGIIGARKNTTNDNNPENDDNPENDIFSQNMHGVAYEVKIKPIAIFDETGKDDTNSEQLAKAINEASGTTIIAMNNSWGAEEKACIIYQGKRYYYTRPPGKNFNDTECEARNYQPPANELTAWKNAVNKGTIVVFANGNHGLNGQTGIVKLYTNPNFSKNDDPNLEVRSSNLFNLADANISSYEAMFPEYDEALKGKWISVIAVDENNNITNFSNGCGITKNYCIAAPGYNVFGPTYTDTSGSSWGGVSGTSQAAPYVTGAIALLKQAFPSMDGAQIVTLIFDSATDLGEAGIDDVYGRGMLNLQAAFQPVGNVSAVTANNKSFGASFNDTSLTLANHFGTQLHNIEIGIRDNYERTFITSPTKIDREPITASLNDYMQDLTSANHKVESYALTPQASLSYQADDNQTWVKLIHDDGNSTASVAFHDNFKLKTLPAGGSDERVLRAFAIRPAGENIAQMNVAHRLNSHLMVSSYAAKGNYDTGHDFNELGSDLTYKSDIIFINIGIGHLREYQQFLGTQGTGAYALDGASLSKFTDINISKKLHKNSRFSLFAHYALYQTDVNMRYQQFADITDLQANHSKIGITGADIISDDDRLIVSLNMQLGVTDGGLVQHTVLGYNKDGSYNNVSNHYDLAVDNRHRQLAISYQGIIHNRHERKNLPLQNRRFFASISIDNHFQHQQDVTQIEMLAGITADF
ncbi:MAG: S8 family serine peptidase [Alphaproteobacteria bacterium]|nr:S8 family serine peptidase [Alphaproteobacteria bacterium]